MRLEGGWSRPNAQSRIRRATEVAGIDHGQYYSGQMQYP